MGGEGLDALKCVRVEHFSPVFRQQPPAAQDGQNEGRRMTENRRKRGNEWQRNMYWSVRKREVTRERETGSEIIVYFNTTSVYNHS